MPQTDLFDLPEKGPLIGLDPGTKTIGVAICDASRLIASPLETIPRGRKLKPTLDRLFLLYEENACVGFVMGLPLNMDGSSGPRVQAVKSLAFNILQRRDVPIAYQDERLSSNEAERVMIAADLTRAKRAKSLDASAAAIILQTALDRLANRKP